MCSLNHRNDGSALQASFEARSSPTARRAVSLLLLTMRAITERSCVVRRLCAKSRSLEKNREELIGDGSSTGARLVQTVGALRSGGRVKARSLDARLMLAFTSEAPNSA